MNSVKLYGPHNKGKDTRVEVTCIICGNIFRDYRFKKRRFCSRPCINKHVWKNHSEEKRRILTENLIKNLNLSGKRPRGEKHWSFNKPRKDLLKNGVPCGNNKVGYRAIHIWVENILGKPNKCSKCGKVRYGHSIQWANISREYKRDITDWMRLCVKCHKQFDKKV